MKYLGSKRRIAWKILPIIISYCTTETTWVEPFVGGGNMIDKVPNTFTRIGADINPHVIAALTAVRDFPEKLPTDVTEEYYRSLHHTEPDPITSWIRFTCSFGAMFENGYARGDTQNYANEARNSALRQTHNLQDIELICCSYEQFSDLKNCIIYCDPPYENTAKYKTTESFDRIKFWEWCRTMSKNNLVFVSEYTAPEDFECVWSGKSKTHFSSQRTETKHVIEKLFTLNKIIL